ncbi:MAG: alpha/beta hydrolase [Firmicutes bacterium]|nr:alpha/beta hydrolase [Bacillota bacterium]
MHGGGGTGKAFQAQLQYFASSYRVIAPDMPGFGQSEWIADIHSVDQIRMDRRYPQCRSNTARTTRLV